MDYFEYTWPDGQVSDCFAHEVLGYRYHWHTNLYELDIVLRGSMEFCHNGLISRLKEDDIIVVNPCSGHASFCLEPNTTALVLHLPVSVFRPFLGSETDFQILFASDEETRGSSLCRQIRYYCALTLSALHTAAPGSDRIVQAAMELLACLLLHGLPKELTSKAAASSGEENSEMLMKLLAIMEQNYSSKLSLQDLAQTFSYNRTYLSSYFKKYIGIGFYEYLTKIRFQHAVWELSSTDESLTQIALKSGFPDLKTFNRLFRETFHMMPAEYRSRLTATNRPPNYNVRRLCSPGAPSVRGKLEEYLRV